MADCIGGNLFIWLFWGIMLIGIIWNLCAHESFLDNDPPDNGLPDSVSKL